MNFLLPKMAAPGINHKKKLYYNMKLNVLEEVFSPKSNT